MRVAHAPGIISPPPTSKELLVSDPSMHLSTCVTHVPWCMSGSLTRGGRENVPGILGACATRNFTHLARGPCWQLTNWPLYWGTLLINFEWSRMKKSSVNVLSELVLFMYYKSYTKSFYTSAAFRDNWMVIQLRDMHSFHSMVNILGQLLEESNSIPQRYRILRRFIRINSLRIMPLFLPLLFLINLGDKGSPDGDFPRMGLGQELRLGSSRVVIGCKWQLCRPPTLQSHFSSLFIDMIRSKWIQMALIHSNFRRRKNCDRTHILPIKWRHGCYRPLPGNKLVTLMRQIDQSRQL